MKTPTIDAYIRAIIADYKAGKDVTSQLVDVRSGGNYFVFHEWATEQWLDDGYYFYLDSSNIPIYKGESFYDYFDESDLKLDNPNAKIAALGLDSKIDIDNDSTFHFKIIDEVCVTCEAEMEGKNGPHYHSLKIYKNLEDAVKTERECGAFLYNGDCLTHCEAELIEIWDNFVLKALNERRPDS